MTTEAKALYSQRSINNGETDWFAEYGKEVIARLDGDVDLITVSVPGGVEVPVMATSEEIIGSDGFVYDNKTKMLLATLLILSESELKKVKENGILIRGIDEVQQVVAIPDSNGRLISIDLSNKEDMIIDLLSKDPMVNVVFDTRVD